MKNWIYIQTLFLFVLNTGCQNDDVNPARGTVTFSMLERSRVADGKPTTGGNRPTAIVLSIKDDNGNFVYQNEKLPLLSVGEAQVSEGLELNAGEYSLIQIFVLDESDRIIYVAPLENSDMAVFPEDALPVHFSVSKNSTTQVVSEVLAVLPDEVSQQYGYETFGFTIAEPLTIKIKTSIELTLGDAVHRNIEAPVTISGYDADGIKKWSEVFQYDGISNEFTVKFGFHHYAIEAEKWHTRAQLTIDGDELWAGRADGPSPVTYIVKGNLTSKKLAYYISYYEATDVVNGGTYFAPNSRVDYEYDASGRLNKMIFKIFVNGQFVDETYSSFTYTGDQVTKISRSLAYNNQALNEFNYEYLPNGKVSSIVEGYAGGVNAEARFIYHENNQTVNVTYSFLNGNGFEYQYDYGYQNLVTDETTKGGQLCSEGLYTYDNAINPFRHLGYIDFTLTNVSINNKKTENVDYLACSFPSLIPESYLYQYNDYGYPDLATTFYQSNNNPARRSKIEFFYVD
jgi:hypothetical protein